ncbi:MAG TPA: hypothetical protein VE974_30260 [Thermoanaerobaculia bacterium]|jgi:hypothetical protein|nr:hypothetical protein [Thermoanaerobaculia bacterium]
MNKNELLTLTDEQIEQVIAAHNPLDCLPIPRPCPEITTLACGEEGPICSAC